MISWPGCIGVRSSPWAWDKTRMLDGSMVVDSKDEEGEEGSCCCRLSEDEVVKDEEDEWRW